MHLYLYKCIEESVQGPADSNNYLWRRNWIEWKKELKDLHFLPLHILDLMSCFTSID